MYVNKKIMHKSEDNSLCKLPTRFTKNLLAIDALVSIDIARKFPTYCELVLVKDRRGR